MYLECKLDAGGDSNTGGVRASEREIRWSGLWNIDHPDGSYTLDVLDRFEDSVDAIGSLTTEA